MIRKYFIRQDGHMQEVLKNASAALAIRIFGTLLGFAVSVLIARSLGADGAGIYFLAVAVATIAATIGRLGFDNTVVRFIASHASAHEWGAVLCVNRIVIRVVSTASLLVAIALFLGAGWIANTLFHKPFMDFPLRIVAVVVLPMALAMIQADSLRGLKSIPASQWIKTVFISLGTLISFYPFVRMWGVNGAVVAYVLAAVVTSFMAWVLWRKALRGKTAPNTNVQTAPTVSSLMKSSWPLYGVALTGLAMQQAPTIFLGIWGTAADVGVFNVANRVASLLLFPLLAMISTLAPKFSVMYRQGDLAGLQRLACGSSRMLILVAVPIAVLVAIASEWILAIFGSEFTRGGLVLNFLLIGVVVNASTGAVAELLMMSGHEKAVSVGVAFSASISLALCLFLVPAYGPVGAAIAASSGMGIQNVLMTLKVRAKLGFWPIALIFK